MKKLFVIAACLMSLFLSSCAMLSKNRVMKIPSRVPKGWQGTHF